MKLIIDRFEGEYAVCEAEDEMRNIAKIFLPKNASEGDVLVEKNGEYTIDYSETERRRKAVRDLQNKLFK